jgi:hypothetical protein
MVMLSSTQLSEELTKGYQRLTSSLISTSFVTQELRTSGGSQRCGRRPLASPSPRRFGDDPV